MISASETFEWNGFKIAWGRIGSGPDLVLVHGTPFSSHVWHRVAPQLTSRYTVHFYDLPGYGHSSMFAGRDISLGVQNEAFAAILEFWNLSKPNVIAHDFGGATVLRAHFLSGCEFQKLLLFDAVALRPWGSSFVQHVRRHESAFAGVPNYIQQAILKAYISGAIHRQMSDEELEPYLRPWLGPIGQPAFYRQIAQMDERFTDEVQDRYATLRYPVRLLWGRNDGWIPLDRGRELAALFGCDLAIVENCGHLMQEDAPEAILAATEDFF